MSLPTLHPKDEWLREGIEVVEKKFRWLEHHYAAHGQKPISDCDSSTCEVYVEVAVRRAP